MRAEAARLDLTRALAQIVRFVQTSNTISILNNVLLTFADGTLTLRATDLAVEVTCAIPATGDDFVACVPAKNFADIARRLPGDTVTMEIDGSSLKVKSGRSRFNLPVIPDPSFPTLAADAYDCTFTADLSALLARVSFAAGVSTHANTDGLCVHIEGGSLVAVATDSKAMAVYRGALPAGATGMPAIIIPAKLASLLPKGSINVSVRASRLLIETEDATICAKLIEGNYVQYQRAIPQTNDKTVRVRRADLAAAVERIALVAINARLSIAPGSIALSGQDSDGREATDEVATEYHGEPTYVAFGCRYLTDMLSALPGDEIEIDITDNTTFTRFRSLSDAAFVGVLGPYRM